MPRLFRFVRGVAAFNVTEAIAASPTMSRLRDSLTRQHGPHAAALVEDMMVVVMRRAGDHYQAVRGVQIDRIMDIRTRVDGIYSSLLRRDSTVDIDAELNRLMRDYAELDNAIADASSPIESFELSPAQRDAIAAQFRQDLLDPDSNGLQSGRFLEQDTQSGGRIVDEDFRDAAGRVPGDADYRYTDSRAHRKDWRPDPNDPSTFTNTFEDGSSARLRVENVDGRDILVVTTRQRDGTELTIREEAVLVDPYGLKPRTTSLFNAHHGLQAAPMEARFGSLYDRHAAPTIWLRNSRSGSPHGRITAIEGRTSAHTSEPGSRLTPAEIGEATYPQMRRTAEREMRSVGVSEQAIRSYLTAHDVYMRDNVFPHIPAARRAELFGDWTPMAVNTP